MNKKLTLKNIALITSITLCITACGKKEEVKRNFSESKTTKSIEREITTKPIIETEIITKNSEKLTTNYINDNESITTMNTQDLPEIEQNSTISSESQDTIVLNYFDSLKSELKEYANKEDWENIKKKGKEYIVSGIDFVFFDCPIKGVYFKDLTAEGKRLAILNIESALEFIEEIYPDFSSTLNEKYQKASLFINEKYLNSLDKIKDYLGEENYNAIGDVKDQIKEDISEGKNKIENSLKKKYQEWKNK